MVISSRTPEGEPNRCPLCNHHVRIEPSCLTPDAPCPYCGHLLWFHPAGEAQPALGEKSEVVRIERLVEQLIMIASSRFGPADAGTIRVLRSIRLAAQVETLLDLALRTRTWDDLFAAMWEAEARRWRPVRRKRAAHARRRG